MAEQSKLSDSQLAVLRDMTDGWELGMYSGFSGGARIQKGGLGKGGQARNVHIGTFSALLQRDLIVRGPGSEFPVTRYRLTPAGRKAAKAAS
jgi:hypothetical protein